MPRIPGPTLVAFALPTLAVITLGSGCKSERCSPGEVPNYVLKACVIPKECAPGEKLNPRNECVPDPEGTGGVNEADAAIAMQDGGIERGAPNAAGGTAGARANKGPTDAAPPDSTKTSAAACGNGRREGDELCDGADCPTECIPASSCLEAKLEGAPETCDARCTTTEVNECISGDGCCGASCKYPEDSDCSPSCGDGVVDAAQGELCEPSSPNTPCPETCDDDDPCTEDARTGTPEKCNVECTHKPITVAAPGDQCCPVGANANSDDDCSATCGNGVREAAEKCDGDCPTSCEDADPCTRDSLSGSRESCTATCRHEPMNRSGNSSCDDGDPCTEDKSEPSDTECSYECRHQRMERSGPSSCDDGDPCTEDKSEPSDTECSYECEHSQITRATNGDHCCPNGANAATDTDCDAECGNGIVEAGEECESGARSSGSDGLAPGTVYDSWSCDAESCKRRYVYTPCRSNGDCRSGDGVCDRGYCSHSCDSNASLKPNNMDPHSYNCEFENGRLGLCFGDSCLLKCDSRSGDLECRGTLGCDEYGGASEWKICGITSR